MEKLISKLISTFSVSGHEDCLKKIIIEELKDCDIKLYEDKMGNLVARKINEGAEKWMISAHMDSIGVIATFIEDNGYVRCTNIGNFKGEDVTHSFVKFKDGTIGRLGSSSDEMFIDLGMKNKEEVKKIIREGDTAYFIAPNINLCDEYIVGANLDNRIGCYVLINLIKSIKNSSKDLYFVFSTQEELGGRGARAAAFTINPDYCLVVDLENSGDNIGGESKVKLGEGAVVKLMDSTLIMHKDIKDKIQEVVSKDNSIKVQYCITQGRSEGGKIQKEVNGIKTGEIAIPCRYNHTVSEMVSKKDIENILKLLKKVLE